MSGSAGLYLPKKTRPEIAESLLAWIKCAAACVGPAAGLAARIDKINKNMIVIAIIIFIILAGIFVYIVAREDNQKK